MQRVYLICGVPGSGKTWVCKQLADQFEYIPHDQHFKNHAEVLIQRAKEATRPIITECPFAERVLREQLEKRDIEVVPVFVIEEPDTVQKRYEDREKRPIPKNFVTRATSIIERAKEWRALYGTSEAILQAFKSHPFMEPKK